MNNDAITKRETDEAVAEQESRYTYTPKCDVWETESAVYLEAELPGVDDKDVDVSLEDNVLTILGRVRPPELDGYSRAYHEYEAGNFERSFRMSNEIDEEKIAATLKHGVLRLELPKREAARPRRISVVSAA